MSRTRRRVPLECNDKSLTQQSFRDSVDINSIISRFSKQGGVPAMEYTADLFADFSSLGSYQDCMNAVIDANEIFDTLPPGIRNRFSNSPGDFLDFVSDPSNLDEMIELGLAPKAPETPDLGGTTPPLPVETTEE